MRLSPCLSEFKPPGAANKAELACVSGGSHVVVICSHGNLSDGENELGSNMVILQFQHSYTWTNCTLPAIVLTANLCSHLAGLRI